MFVTILVGQVLLPNDVQFKRYTWKMYSASIVIIIMSQFSNLVEWFKITEYPITEHNFSSMIQRSKIVSQKLYFQKLVELTFNTKLWCTNACW